MAPPFHSCPTLLALFGERVGLFGNINKTGSQSFTPTYSNSTNQINGGGYSQSYDANGNLLTINDGTTHTYTWDAEGKQLGIDSFSAIYDALGRMVELNSSGTYTETVYGLAGEKLALLNGQTLKNAFVATPSGTAVYVPTGLLYYRHADWLGSSRFASTTGRSMYSSSAYAPFGEQYAKAGTNDQNFTGQQPDTASGLYDFLFRRLSQTQGRWISPDPAGIGAVDPTAPQSWNRYAYVTNNPLRFADQLGLMLGPCSVPGVICMDEGGGSMLGYGDCASFYMDGMLWGSGCNSPDITSGQQQDTGNDGTDSKGTSSANNGKPICIPKNSLNWSQRAQLEAAKFWANSLAQLLGGIPTVGFGVGGDAGGGLGPKTWKWNFGGGGSLSTLIVADASGNSGLLNSASGGFSVTKMNSASRWGAGAAAGPSFLVSPFSIDQIKGPSGAVSAGGGMGVLGAGGSLSTSGALTLTAGWGAGAEVGFSPQGGNSWFIPFCQD